MAAPAAVLRRPEAWFILVAAVAALTLQWSFHPPIAKESVHLYYQLASAFFAGVIAAMLWVLGELHLRALPPDGRTRIRALWLAAAGGLALVLATAVRPPNEYVTTRVCEAAELSLLGTVGMLAIFLPVSGLISARASLRAFSQLCALWLPILVYLAGADTVMSTIRLHTPLVYDPLLLRMDLSLGFSPSEAISAWTFRHHGCWLFFDRAYPLLGAFLGAVTAWLQLSAGAAQARRCMAALMLVGLLGMGCYRLVPAVGPCFAYPELFSRPAVTPSLRQADDAIRGAAIRGPIRAPRSLSLQRNVMPSLHVAFSLAALAAVWNWRRRYFWACLPIGATLIASALMLCVHYAVDVVAAVPFAAVCWTFADWSVRRSPGPGEETLPPLAADGAVRRRRAFQFSGALALCLAAFAYWAWRAPLPPWEAWPLALFIAGGPAVTAIRLHAQPPGFRLRLGAGAAGSLPASQTG